MELSRDEDGELQFWVGDFCTQEHAAEWLQLPLPASIGQSPDPGPATWRDRLEAGGCFAVLAVVLALLLVGSWTVAQFVLDRF